MTCQTDDLAGLIVIALSPEQTDQRHGAVNRGFAVVVLRVIVLLIAVSVRLDDSAAPCGGIFFFQLENIVDDLALPRTCGQNRLRIADQRGNVILKVCLRIHCGEELEPAHRIAVAGRAAEDLRHVYRDIRHTRGAHAQCLVADVGLAVDIVQITVFGAARKLRIVAVFFHQTVGTVGAVAAAHVPYVIVHPAVLDDLGGKSAVGAVHIPQDVLVQNIDAEIVVVPDFPKFGLGVFQQLIGMLVFGIVLGVRTVAQCKPTVGHGKTHAAIRVLGELIARKEADRLRKESRQGLILVRLDREYVVALGVRRNCRIGSFGDRRLQLSIGEHARRQQLCIHGAAALGSRTERSPRNAECISAVKGRARRRAVGHTDARGKCKGIVPYEIAVRIAVSDGAEHKGEKLRLIHGAVGVKSGRRTARCDAVFVCVPHVVLCPRGNIGKGDRIGVR